MNKRYIDFVPTKSARGLEIGLPEASKRVTRSRKVVDSMMVRPKKTGVAKTVGASRSVKTAGVATPVRQKKVHAEVAEEIAIRNDAFSLKKEPNYGVIEELKPKFVKTEVPKRPLGDGQSHFRVKKTPLEEVKLKKVGLGRGHKVEEKVTETKAVTSVTSGAYKTPKSPFINQAKVKKRPLSKNVYQKKIETPKETPVGPVTIISKPEKDKHIGVIVTIILTIILGAAAGTVAFLLLPK